MLLTEYTTSAMLIVKTDPDLSGCSETIAVPHGTHVYAMYVEEKKRSIEKQCKRQLARWCSPPEGALR